MREDNIAGLTVRLAGGTDRMGGGDGPLVVLLHGYGAPGDDLVPLWRVMDVPREVRFAFPAAPLPLPQMMMGFGDSRAWWHLDPSLFEDIQYGRVRDRTNDVPDGLAEARAIVVSLLDELSQRLAPSALFLGGFSQGAMLSLDVALHTERSLAGLILMSGTLLARPIWEPKMAARAGLRVMQSHGMNDPLLPFSFAERLRDLLVSSGMAVDWVPFRGAHEIPERVLERASALISGDWGDGIQ